MDDTHIPKLRFPGFQEEWNSYRLGNVSEKIQDGTHFSPITFEKESFKYITSKNIRNGYMDLEDISFIEENTHKEIYKRCDVKYNDVLITKDGASAGNVCLNELHEEFSLLSSVAFIRADNSITRNDFIYQYIVSPIGQNEIQSYISGQAITRITLEKLKRFNIYLPSLPEQTKIASFFTAIDEKLQALKQKKSLLEQYKKGVMQKIFSRELRFKDENGKEFPDWEEKKLGEISSMFSGGTPLTTKREYFDGKIPFIRSGEINSEETGQHISDLGLKNSSAKIVKKGDILYALYGATSGEVGLSKINGAINQAVLCIRSEHNHYFLSSYLRYNKDNIIKTFLQGGQGNLSAEIIKNIQILLPSKSEQILISEFLYILDKKINQIQIHIEKIEQWKKGLLQKMFI